MEADQIHSKRFYYPIHKPCNKKPLWIFDTLKVNL